MSSDSIVKGENGRYYPCKDGVYFYRCLDNFMVDSPYTTDVYWRVNFGTHEEAEKYLDSYNKDIEVLETCT